jgi:hypothetical protein
MEAKVASIIQPNEIPVQRIESGKKRETSENPAATLEKEINKTRGKSGS